jgi:hypothetical protein
MTDNMKIYNAVRAVPAEAKKAFNNGKFSGTDINPMWRIKTLTEQFGPAGIGWYTETLSERSETYGETVMAIVDINLYVKVGGEWSKPIFGTGGNALVKETKSGAVPSDEGYKMAYTDALSVACKALGIGADVYFEKDKDKYTDWGEGDRAATITEAQKAEFAALAINVENTLRYFKVKNIDELTEAQAQFAIDGKRKAAKASEDQN